MRRLRAFFIIAGDRQRPCIALVVGWRRAAFARSTINVSRSHVCDAARNRGAKFRKLI
jgi:hypothetical protein